MEPSNPTTGTATAAGAEAIDRYRTLFDGDAELAALWVSCKSEGDPVARSRLVEIYVPLVRYVVSRMNLTLPPSLERGDLVGFGIIGLMDAIGRFDLDRGLTFQTYAMIRIRGAIIDELRSLDWVPRTVRGRMHRIDRATEDFEHRHGREPAIEDIAGATGLDRVDVRSTLIAYQNGYVSSLDQRMAGDDERPDRQLVDDTVELPDEVYDHAESESLVREQLRGLPPRDRAVVALYYYEELTFAEIGRVLHVSESRVCQLHGRAIRALREAS